MNIKLGEAIPADGQWYKVERLLKAEDGCMYRMTAKVRRPEPGEQTLTQLMDSFEILGNLSSDYRAIARILILTRPYSLENVYYTARFVKRKEFANEE